MMTELDAFAAVCECHDTLALGFGHWEHVLEDGGGAQAKRAAPAKIKGVQGFKCAANTGHIKGAKLTCCRI